MNLSKLKNQDTSLSFYDVLDPFYRAIGQSIDLSLLSDRVFTQVCATTRKRPIGESEAFFLHSALLPRGTFGYANKVRSAPYRALSA